jgi:hypothetical protein
MGLGAISARFWTITAATLPGGNFASAYGLLTLSAMDITGETCQAHVMLLLINILRRTLVIVLLAAPAQADEAMLTKRDMVQLQPSIWAAKGLELPEQDATLPIVGPRNTEDGVRLLRIYNGNADINGFAGILYDNRDRGHSSLNPELYPRLTHLKYGSDLAAENLDFGLAGAIILPAVVFGNSSAALDRGAAARSLPRLAMTDPFWRAVTPILYASNHIYVYPEHRDHDAEDRFPANWPYMITSQGSSGSDQRFLNAIALTLAAFRRDTFAVLQEKGLVAPTVQMILRRNLATVLNRADYLSGVAHPAAFDGSLVRTGRMVAQAAELRPDEIPPMVQLRVIKEDFTEAAGLARMDERLFDTPAAIARLWRGFAWERELVVTTEDTSAPNDRPITFAWKVLRGDPDRVRIEPQGPDGRVAKIKIAWHDPWVERVSSQKGEAERRMSRVDIGVFASNGVHDSAPSFISIDFPEHQIRQYSTGADGEKRLLSIDYDAAGRGAYFDPLLYWSAAWTDTARYDKSGALFGWNRRDAGGTTESFVPDDTGAKMPLYEIVQSDKRAPTLKRAIKED